MKKIKISCVVSKFGENIYKGNFGGEPFPVPPIPQDRSEYFSEILYGNNIKITLYFYTDSSISKEDISLYFL